MKAIAILSLCSAAALASAAPPPDPPPADHSQSRYQEVVQVQNLFVRKEVNGASSKVTSVDFELVGQDKHLTNCSANDYEPPNALPSILKTGTCKDSKYTFFLFPGSQGGGSEFALSVSHEIAPAYGFTGTKDVPTYCIADGPGTTDRKCSQVEPVVYITLKNPLPPTNP